VRFLEEVAGCHLFQKEYSSKIQGEEKKKKEEFQGDSGGHGSKHHESYGSKGGGRGR